MRMAPWVPSGWISTESSTVPSSPLRLERVGYFGLETPTSLAPTVGPPTASPSPLLERRAVGELRTGALGSVGDRSGADLGAGAARVVGGGGGRDWRLAGEPVAEPPAPPIAAEPPPGPEEPSPLPPFPERPPDAGVPTDAPVSSPSPQPANARAPAESATSVGARTSSLEGSCFAASALPPGGSGASRPAACSAGGTGSDAGTSGARARWLGSGALAFREGRAAERPASEDLNARGAAAGPAPRSAPSVSDRAATPASAPWSGSAGTMLRTTRAGVSGSGTSATRCTGPCTSTPMWTVAESRNGRRNSDDHLTVSLPCTRTRLP